MSDLLSSLESVKETGPSRWVARCPAHEDKSPSLSVRELDDGRWLIHCFAGCGGADVMEAVDLTLSDLYPESANNHSTPGRPNHWHAANDALRVINNEARLVVIAAENVVAGISLTVDDRDRLSAAAQRIRRAAEAVR